MGHARLKHTVYEPNCTIEIFRQRCLKGQAIKKIDTMQHCVFLSSSFATTVSYAHNYPSDAGDDRFIVVRMEQDTCSSSR